MLNVLDIQTAMKYMQVSILAIATNKIISYDKFVILYKYYSGEQKHLGCKKVAWPRKAAATKQ